MKSVPLTEKRLAEVIGQYGRAASLLVPAQPDAEKPWQPDDKVKAAEIALSILINDISGLGDADLPDQVAEANGLVVLPPDKAGAARRGARLRLDGQVWQIRHAAVLSRQKRRHILHLTMVQAGGEAP